MTGNSQLIAEVTDVSVSILEKHPPILVVHASGRVSSGGWTNPGLSRVVYITPPADGIQEYKFMATPPSGANIGVMLPVAAQDSWDDPSAWVKGVRVMSASNSLEEAAHLATI